MTPDALDAVLPHLKILARATPRDKDLLVTRLNGRGLPEDEAEWQLEHGGADKDWERHRAVLLPGYRAEWRVKHWPRGAVVGVTGQHWGDAKTLKSADVGIALGTTATAAARAASDLIILDDRLSSVVQAVFFGRGLYDNIRRFLQFQLTVNIVIVALSFLAAAAGMELPLSPVLLLWVNLIMDTMAALALGLEPPTPAVLRRKPHFVSAGLVGRRMWRNILVQAAWQLFICCVVLFNGPHVFGVNAAGECLEYDEADANVCVQRDNTHYTLVFNIFVFCTMVNECNAREIGNNGAVFASVCNNGTLVKILSVTFAVQIMLLELFKPTHLVVGLSAELWVWSVLFGLVSIPLGFGMRRLRPKTEHPAVFHGYVRPPKRGKKGAKKGAKKKGGGGKDGEKGGADGKDGKGRKKSKAEKKKEREEAKKAKKNSKSDASKGSSVEPLPLPADDGGGGGGGEEETKG